jgi:hypothetical protein
MQMAGSPALPSPEAVRYTQRYASYLVVRTLRRIGTNDWLPEIHNSAEGKTYVALCRGEQMHELEMASHDGMFSPDAVRATASLLLRQIGAADKAVQAKFYPLPADGNEEEEV